MLEQSRKEEQVIFLNLKVELIRFTKLLCIGRKKLGRSLGDDCQARWAGGEPFTKIPNTGGGIVSGEKNSVSEVEPTNSEVLS